MVGDTAVRCETRRMTLRLAQVPALAAALPAMAATVAQGIHKRETYTSQTIAACRAVHRALLRR